MAYLCSLILRIHDFQKEMLKQISLVMILAF